tara:strand:+ start:1945 stop:2250 length:306 start_codon:yes stop_codon:yes gene_type:complete
MTLPINNRLIKNNYNNGNLINLIYNPLCRHSLEVYKIIEKLQEDNIDNKYKIRFSAIENSYDGPVIVPQLKIYKNNKQLTERIGVISKDDLYKIINKNYSI